jgi:hypothetical protein
MGLHPMLALFCADRGSNGYFHGLDRGLPLVARSGALVIEALAGAMTLLAVLAGQSGINLHWVPGALGLHQELAQTISGPIGLPL